MGKEKSVLGVTSVDNGFVGPMVPNPHFLMRNSDFEDVMHQFVLSDYPGKNYVFESVALYKEALTSQDFFDFLTSYKEDGETNKLLMEVAFESRRREG